MAIRFNIGDIITVDQGSLDSLSDKDAMVRATKEILGSMSSALLTVTDFGSIGLSDYYIHLVPDDPANPAYRGGQGSIVYFRTYDFLNNSFYIHTTNTVSQVKVLCQNNSSSVMPKGAVVTLMTPGATPGIDLAHLKIRPAIFGVTDEAIAPGATGNVVTRGICKGINTLGAKTGDYAYLGYVAGSVSMIQPTNSCVIGTVSRVASNGSIEVSQHPGGLPADFEYRSIDGTGNNLGNPNWGASSTQLRRMVSIDYADGVALPAGPRRASARKISNILSYQAVGVKNTLSRSDFVWVWGQFLDHDIGLTEAHSPAEPFNISVPSNDGHFTPNSIIPLSRSTYDPATGLDPDSPRQQLTSITSYLDASNVYGADATRAAALRLSDGSGKLKTSTGNLLPFNTGGLPNAPSAGNPALFLAGDVRANAQPILIAMHTLFVREHNRLCDEIVALYPTLTEEQLYQAARRKVIALCQAITYNEFLPALLGASAMPSHSGYDPATNPRIANVFSTAAYRLGHSMLSSILLRLDASNNTISEGNLRLRVAFFAPTQISSVGIEPYLRGAAKQVCQNVDPFTVDEIRNFLFGPPNAGGADLAALNIQRGRDHGLPGYNQVRLDLGLEPKKSFDEMTSDSALRSKLASAYSRAGSVDCWIGGLAEDHLPGSMLGELFHTICRLQFIAFRSGDRLWYQNIFAGVALQEIENTTLADVIRRNTTISSELQNDVFTV